MSTQYKDYYKNHYKVSFSESDVDQWCRWFTGEWRHIRPGIGLVDGMRVLDVGAGSGGFYKILCDEGIDPDYTGLDLDPQIVKFANNHFGTDRFKHQKLEDHITSKKYDLIVAFEVLEHVENPGEFVAKIQKLLKPGGVFCGTTPYPFGKNIVSDATHISVLHPKNWERLFKNAKFSNVETKPMSYLPGLWRIHPAMNVRIPAYVSMPMVVSTTWIQALK